MSGRSTSDTSDAGCPVIRRLVAHLTDLRPTDRLRVAIDGVDGVGKTTFADQLAAAMSLGGRPVVRASVDGFHNPRKIRYRRGKASPEGFYRDSYDYASLQVQLLEPLGRGGSGRYQAAVFDHVRDTALPIVEHIAPEASVLLLDGLFLHRPELRGCWDVSVFLDAPFEITVPRGAARGQGFGSPDPGSASNRRYVEGQRLYLGENRPHDVADIVIDNSDFTARRIVAWRS